MPNDAGEEDLCALMLLVKEGGISNIECFFYESISCFSPRQSKLEG